MSSFKGAYICCDDIEDDVDEVTIWEWCGDDIVCVSKNKGIIGWNAPANFYPSIVIQTHQYE